MCTVSVIIQNEKIILTSNRDEKTQRLPALFPVPYSLENKVIYYAKDTQANGTWFACDSKGNAVVLLNGGFRKHEPQPDYRKSRGLVVVDIISSLHPFAELETYPLENIEPFHLIFTNGNHVKRMIWDGEQKYFFYLHSKASIYSSVTLYDEEIIREREQLFQSFLETKPIHEASDLFAFHQQNHDEENGFVMNRNNKVKTISISQLVIGNGISQYRYLDLQLNQESNHTIQIQK
ncbi:MAG: NRDE family protein [Bacteroidia bacterium]